MGFDIPQGNNHARKTSEPQPIHYTYLHVFGRCVISIPRWMVEYVKFPLKSLHTEFSVIMSNCNEILCNGRSVAISIKNCYQSRLWHQRWNLHNKIICIPQALSSYPSDEYYQALNCRQCKDPFLPFTLPRCVARILVSCKKAFPVFTEYKS